MSKSEEPDRLAELAIPSEFMIREMERAQRMMRYYQPQIEQAQRMLRDYEPLIRQIQQAQSLMRGSQAIWRQIEPIIRRALDRVAVWMEAAGAAHTPPSGALAAVWIPTAGRPVSRQVTNHLAGIKSPGESASYRDPPGFSTLRRVNRCAGRCHPASRGAAATGSGGCPGPRGRRG